MTVAALQFETVLIIGAGEGDDLQDWQSTDAKRIILVEPNPACAPALKKAMMLIFTQNLAGKADNFH